MSELLRVYSPEECGPDGYPLVWHRGAPAIKHLVRELAGHRCVRCGHPYRTGSSPPEWSPCDERCKHDGPIRVWLPEVDAWAEPVEAVGPETYPNHELVEARWRVLTVHHLTGIKRDCRWWNLAALCQRCHLQIQGRVLMAQVYPHEHSEWMKPYAAGYYAWTYLDEYLGREQTMARLDELLALERT